MEFFRAIPVLLLMMFAAALYREFTTISSDFRPLYAVVTALVLYNASVIAEVVRAGVLSLPRGQGDAAEALGMRKSQTMTYVLLPQAVTVMLPALVSQLVVIVKDTALGGAMLGYAELLSQNRQITANYGANTIATFTVIALIYIVINAILTSLAGRLEKRLRRGKKSGAVIVPAQGAPPPWRRRRSTNPDPTGSHGTTGVGRSGTDFMSTAPRPPRRLTQAPSVGCIRSVINHRARATLSCAALMTVRPSGAAPWTR